MREQVYLRIALALAAVGCGVNFAFSREAVDLAAAGLFVLVTWSTGQRRRGAFMGAVGAAAALLVIRIHQYLTGLVEPSIVFVLNLVLPAAALVLGLLAIWKLPQNKR
jgi:hypothetical protein